VNIYFSRDEASVLCDIFEGAHEDNRMSDHEYLYRHVQDSLQEYDYYTELWGLDETAVSLLLTRLEQFTEVESSLVLRNIRSFWSSGDEVSMADPDLHDALVKAELISPNERFHYNET